MSGHQALPFFVREPEGDGCRRALHPNLEGNLLWVPTFKTIEDLRAELVAFARRYNGNLARRAA